MEFAVAVKQRLEDASNQSNYSDIQSYLEKYARLDSDAFSILYIL